jgi:two-component system, chemotaxis family, sensor kinase CheA
MSGFDAAELLPFYLDETDEHVATLNEMLLRLEQDPDDAKALQEAFRMFHSIKGASAIMAFAPVKELTHHLESLFEQLRTKKRALDRPTLDLAFRCLDELRDYHRELRSQGQSSIDLVDLTAHVIDFLRTTASADTGFPNSLISASPAKPPLEPTPTAPAPLAAGTVKATQTAPTGQAFAEPSHVILVVVFEPNLPLADMKAQLVLNRLSTKARVLRSDPPVDRMDEGDPLTTLTVYLATESDPQELRELADVEGVREISVEPSVSAQLERRDEQFNWPQVAPPQSAPEQAFEKAVAPHSPDAATPTELEVGHPVAGSPAAGTPTLAGSGPAHRTASTQSANGAKKPKVAETIRVDSDRLDYLMNLAGELVITKARFIAIARNLEELFRGSNAHALTLDTRERIDSITRSLEGLTEIKTGLTEAAVDRWSVHVRRLRDNFRAIQDELSVVREAREQMKALAETIHSLGRVSDSLQKGVLNTRMVPIGPLFERFRRVIRDLSLSSGKEVSLSISGEKTELDKRMIDELSDPLIHMVRNAVDHGLELPAEREGAGKPRTGVVSLLASHRGNSVVVAVSDDGRGIDCERIRRKIVAKGLISETEARDLSERELVAYIWHPGLSTAETITELSGRGVGMDIVKSRIENLSGSVDVRSAPGQGTTMTIRLPLTLAIMSSLLVRIYDEIYAIPLDHVDEIVEIPSGQIYKVQGRPAIEIRKKIVALVALGDVFHWGGKVHPAMANGNRHGASLATATSDSVAKHIVVVVQNGETTIGLLVDHLIGMQEVVLKSLEKNFRAIPGVSGASILGDGRVSLILDLDAVLDLLARRHAPRASYMATVNFDHR